MIEKTAEQDRSAAVALAGIFRSIDDLVLPPVDYEEPERMIIRLPQYTLRFIGAPCDLDLLKVKVKELISEHFPEITVEQV